MSRHAEEPVTQVVSFRVTDEEKEFLLELARRLGVNVSTLVRESLNLETKELQGGGQMAGGAPCARDFSSGMSVLVGARATGLGCEKEAWSAPGWEGKNHYSIKSVENALVVLEAFADSGAEVSLTQLSEFLGMGKSNLFRILATFQKFGYVEKNQKSGKYRLGLSAYGVGQKCLSRMTLLTKAQPVMERLAQQCRETVYLAVPGEKVFLMLDMVDTPQVVTMAPLVGNSYPLAGNAVGGAIQEARARFDYGSFGEGTACVAVPFFAGLFHVAGSLCLIGPEFRFAPERIEHELLPRLKTAGEEISTRLGCLNRASL